MPRVKLTVTTSTCRAGLHRQGEVFYVDGICPPICHELWHAIYPSLYVLLNAGDLDLGEERAQQFKISCPDGGRVEIFGEVAD